MNLLKLKSFDGTYVTYEYQPEGKGDAGIVTLNITTGNSEINKVASEDFETKHYGKKAIYKIEKLLEQKDLPMEFIQAWN